MPRPVSTQILNAKKLGKWFNLVRIDLQTPLYLTDNNFDVVYESNIYRANGLLLEVDSGAMTAGVEANDWEITLSAVLDDFYSGVLAQNLNNRWVYHYVAYFEENANGISVIGVENKKFGQILSFEDSDDEQSGAATFIITGPLGNTEQSNELKTNVTSHQRRFAGDEFFKYAHETDFKIPRNSARSGVTGSIAGTKISVIPQDEQ